MQFQKSLLTATLLAAASLTAVSANAATATGAFDVKLQITSVCSVTAASGANDIDFGPYAAGTLASAITEKSSAVPITVKCSKNAPYVINLTPSNNNGLGAGIMTGPAGAAGQATEPADTVAYQLTKTAGGDIWGDGGVIGTVGNGVGGIGAGLAVDGNPHTVYAKVTGSTDVRPGNYKDTVTVNVTY